MNPDREALFKQALEAHGAALGRLARVYEHEPTRAEDLFQEICLAIWQALGAWRQESSLRTFVFRIAHNRGTTHSRHEGRRRALPLDDRANDARDPAPGAEADLQRRRQQQRLQIAVRDLPLGYRQVVTLKLEGLSSPEIGEVLGLSAGTVRVQLHRAQNMLANLLRDARPAKEKAS